ncbi:MAG: DUF3572 domain-containing protein [Parvibaculaceae bacterium]|nr:DUF3572 domain-containing protein [Parvibaculaceae bacterium]
MTPEAAETLALEAISFIAGDEDLVAGLLDQTGMGVDELRDALGKADTVGQTLAGVLDYLLMNDEWVLNFAEQVNIAPEKVLSARAALPGGLHWGSI